MPVERRLQLSALGNSLPPGVAVACNRRCLSSADPAAQLASSTGCAALQDAAGVRMRGLLDRVETLLSSDADPQVGFVHVLARSATAG